MILDLLQVILAYIDENSLYISFVLIGALVFYELCLYPFFLSPLRDIPGPYLYRVSRIFILEQQRRHSWVLRTHQLHQEYGDVVVVSPNEVIFNGKAKYLNDIYVKNLPKSKFYENFRNHGFKDNIFASLENDKHLKYKKMIMGLYSKSNLYSFQNPFRQSLVKKIRELCNQVYVSSISGEIPDIINAKSELNEFGKGHDTKDGKWLMSRKTKNLGIDVYSLFGSLAMDVVSSFELGEDNGTQLLSKQEEREIVVYHRQVSSMVFWTTLMPKFWDYAASSPVLKATRVLDKWRDELYSTAESNIPKVSCDSNLTVLETLKKHGLHGDYAYSFLTDNIFAGHETTAIQLSYLTYELSRPANFRMQEKLRNELYRAFGKAASRNEIIDDFEALDKLEYLNSLIDESNRVHTSIPGAEPRVVDKPYTINLSPDKKVTLPIGTIVSCQPYSIHRNPQVFKDPDCFVPERWLKSIDESDVAYKARITLQNKHMIPFGKGIRMCLGMNIALIDVKMALANLYWHYNSKISAEWAEIVQPKSDQKYASPIMLCSHLKDTTTDEEKMTMFDAYTTRPYHDECWLEWYLNSDTEM